MAHTMQMGAIAAPTSKEQRTYTVNLKGLFAHLFDILFVDDTPRSYNSDQLSSHMQRDIGLYR